MNYVYLLCNGSMEVLKEEMVVAILGMYCIADDTILKGGKLNDDNDYFFHYFRYAFLIMLTLKGRQPNEDKTFLGVIFGMNS